MSTATAQEFITKVKNDPQLLAELRGVDTSSPGAALNDAVAIAAKHDFQFSADDLESAIQYEVSAENLERFKASADGSKVY